MMPSLKKTRLLVLTLTLAFAVARLTAEQATSGNSHLELQRPNRECLMPVALAPAKPKTAAPDHTGAVAGPDNVPSSVQVDARYMNREQFVEWLLKHGGLILLLDREGRVVAEATSSRDLSVWEPRNVTGVWREANDLIQLWNPPPEAFTVAVNWPRHLWTRILENLSHPDAVKLSLVYRVTENSLVVQRKLLILKNGKVTYQAATVTL